MLCLVLFYINSQELVDKVISPMAYTIIYTHNDNEYKLIPNGNTIQ